MRTYGSFWLELGSYIKKAVSVAMILKAVSVAMIFTIFTIHTGHLQELQKHGSPDIILALVGNKADLQEKRKVSVQVRSVLSNQMHLHPLPPVFFIYS